LAANKQADFSGITTPISANLAKKDKTFWLYAQKVLL
jgi:hypothetical protein